MLNLEGQGETDGNSIYSKDESFKNLFSKNEDMLSLNYSSIQPYNRDEPLNTDFYDWAGSNFLGGHDLVSYTHDIPTEHPPGHTIETYMSTTITTSTLVTTTTTTAPIFTIA